MYEIDNVAEELAAKIVRLPAESDTQTIEKLLSKELHRMHEDGTLTVASEDPDYSNG